MKNGIKLRVSMAFLLIVNVLAPSLHASAPGEMNYQGKLTDSSGNPLTGPYSMRFRICNDPLSACTSGPTEMLYDSGATVVTVTNGVFQVTVTTVAPELYSIPVGASVQANRRSLQIRNRME